MGGGTVIGSDFDYKEPEFTSQAIGNRLKRYQKITPIMQWEFHRDMVRMMTKIRFMPPEVDDKPPKRPKNLEQAERYRKEVEEGRLKMIRKENGEMLERLRKIHKRPPSSFCHLKKIGAYRIRGDSFSLKPPKNPGHGKPLYLVHMYKKLKLANPMSARKSIRIQQEMLTSAIDLVQRSNINMPTPQMVEAVVQSTLAIVDEAPPTTDGEQKQLSPIELVQLANPIPEVDVKILDDIVAEMAPIFPPLDPPQDPSRSEDAHESLDKEKLESSVEGTQSPIVNESGATSPTTDTQEPSETGEPPVEILTFSSDSSSATVEFPTPTEVTEVEVGDHIRNTTNRRYGVDIFPSK